MAKYHYSERVGDFAPCKANNDCPLGDTKHIEVTDDMTIGDFNKLKEEFYKEQYDGSISSGLKKDKNVDTILPIDSNDSSTPFNGDNYDPREYTMKIDASTYISQLVQPGSTFAFKNKVHQVKDTKFDKFSGNITIRTTNGEKIVFNEASENSFRASAKEALLANVNGDKYIDSPFKRADWRDMTRELPLSEIKPGMMYGAYSNADPKLVIDIDHSGDYGGDDYTLTLMDSEGETTKENISDNYTQDATFYTVENERFDASEVDDRYYSGEKFYEASPSDEEVGDIAQYSKSVGAINGENYLKPGVIFRHGDRSYKVKKASVRTTPSNDYGEETILKIETTDGEEIYYNDSIARYDDDDKIWVNPNVKENDDWDNNY